MSRLIPPVLVILLVLAVAGGARADTFCVHEPEGCTGTTAATVQAALDAAAALPGRDRVEVGYDAPDPEPVSIVAGNVVDVVGIERPTLLLEGSATVSVQEPGAVVSGFTFLPTGATAGPPLAAGTLADSYIYAGGAHVVIRLGDATLRNVMVESGRYDVAGVEAVGPHGLVEDSVLFGDPGLVSTSAGLIVRRTRVLGGIGDAGSAAAKVTAGAVTFDASVVDTYEGRDGVVGLDVAPGPAGATVTVDGSTLAAGADSLLTTGLRATCDGATTAAVHLVDTAVAEFGLDLERAGAGCAVDLDHVRYASRDPHGGAFTDGPGVSSGPVAPFAWFSPGVGSALIDAGRADPAPGAVDIDGDPRVVDGDGDGSARRDIGAVEYQRAAPEASIDGPSTLTAGTWGYFDAYGAYDPDPADVLQYEWTADGDAVPAMEDSDGMVLRQAFATAGTHRIGLTVTDPTGQQATATRTVDVRPGPSTTTRPPRPPVTIPGRTPETVPPGPGPLTAAQRTSSGVTAVLVSRRLGRRGGPLRVRVTCLRRPNCKGKVALSVTRGAPAAVPATRVGSAGFVVGYGRTGTVAVPVSRAARTFVRRRPRTAQAVVTIYRLSGSRWTSGQGGPLRP